MPLTREQVAAAQADGGNGKVTVGFRPEDTTWSAPSEGGMPIIVDLVEDLGSDANVYGHAALNGGDGAVRGPHRPAAHAEHGRDRVRQAADRRAPRLPRRHRHAHLTYPGAGEGRSSA